MRSCRAFTLIELLLALVIMALLSALLFVVGSTGRMKSQETTCLSNLRQIGAAIRMYETDYDVLPEKLDQVYPVYVTSSQLFRCPSWEALLSAETAELQQKGAERFTMYVYMPAERAFWAQVPPEPGDPPNLRLGWDQAYERRGEKTPLITCQFHDPLLLTTRRQVRRDGVLQMTRLVLRVDGSVNKSIIQGKNGLSWIEL